jgi:hypothetical protein
MGFVVERQQHAWVVTLIPGPDRKNHSKYEDHPGLQIKTRLKMSD